jgi:hypothetical protein
MTTDRQLSFAAGEVSPALYGRVDTVRHATGLRTCRNFMVGRHGGVINRPGTEFVVEVKDSTKAVRLIPFVFNADQTYMLEFGNLYVRFIKDGAQLGAPLEIATPYLEAELPAIGYAQSGDIITLVHPNHAPRELRRVGPTDLDWTLTTITFAPTIARPTNVLATPTAGAGTLKYRVTAVAAADFEESLSGLEATKNITGITKADPAVVSIAGHGYSNGDEVYITGVVGMTEVNGRSYTIGSVAAGTFALVDIDSTGFTAWSSGGTAARTSAVATSAIVPVTLTWTKVDDFLEYRIYKESYGIYEFIGSSTTETFVDPGITPDASSLPPVERNPFLLTGNYPSTVTYYQGRRVFGNTDNNPESVFTSRVGFHSNMSVSSPLQDDDAVTFRLSSRQVNEVRHLVELGRLIVFTSGAEWAIQGDAAGVLKPDAVNRKAYTLNGSGLLPPLVIGGNALYLQARGSIVRDFGYDFQADGYRGNDLTIFSQHLFERYTMSDWAYQQVPHSNVWIVRSDGTLLGLTYLREHQVIGWHRHDTDGTFENVAVVPEGDEDSVYLVVQRTIDGSDVRYIERMHTRQVDPDLVEDSIFMDSSLSYDGRHTGSTTMTLSGGPPWTHPNTLTLTASAGFFVAGDVGNEIHLTGSDGDVIRAEITAYTSTTVVTVRPHKTVPASLQDTAASSWAKAVDTFAGLGHLEGEEVSVFADAFVIGSPNNASATTYTVASGEVTLDRPYAVVHIGLPYISDIETLDLDTVQGETMVDKNKFISSLALFVQDSRGIFAGPEPPTGDTVDPLEGLNEFKLRNTEEMEDPVALSTGVVKENIFGRWNNNGRVFIRQVDPIPLTILSLAPSGLIPYR